MKTTEYTIEQHIENEKGWLFYDAAFKCFKEINKHTQGENILDIGCSGGVLISLLKIFNPNKSFFGLEGNDSFQTMWDDRNIQVYVDDVYSTNFSDRQFDTVITSHVIEHLEDPKRFIKECSRICKRMIHVVPEDDVFHKNFGSPHLTIFNRVNFLELFSDSDFELVVYESIQDTHMNSLIYVADV